MSNYQGSTIDANPADTGIVILHIDESVLADPVNSARGYPGQTCWPWNGNHYYVAMLAADGLYVDVERRTTTTTPPRAAPRPTCRVPVCVGGDDGWG